MKSMNLQAHHHSGGTLVGFVVGLLVGLGIALSVAVYVTRVPVPFVDRGVSRKPAQDIEEAERNKGWNPNAQLSGKTVPLPSAPAGTDTGAIIVPPADGQALPPPPSATASTSKATATKPGSDPLGDLANARLGLGTSTVAASATKGTPSTAGGADPFTYFVQAGAFKSAEDAEAQRAKLAMLGMAADVSEREQAGRTVYRVRLGPFSQKAMADATREQLEVNGMEAALVRIQR